MKFFLVITSGNFLVTPLGKSENVKFYTEKCNFQIDSIEKDGNVELFRFIKRR